jgi:hypothetical protein
LLQQSWPASSHQQSLSARLCAIAACHRPPLLPPASASHHPVSHPCISHRYAALPQMWGREGGERPNNAASWLCLLCTCCCSMTGPQQQLQQPWDRHFPYHTFLRHINLELHLRRSVGVCQAPTV